MNRTTEGQELHGLRPFGSAFQKQKSRNLNLRVRDFVDIGQSEPIPTWYGTVRFAGVAITPCFDMKSKDVSEGGK